jgi:hypothetical protein
MWHGQMTRKPRTAPMLDAASDDPKAAHGRAVLAAL